MGQVDTQLDDSVVEVGRVLHARFRPRFHRRGGAGYGFRLLAVVVYGRYRERIFGSVGQSGRLVSGRVGLDGGASVSGRPAYGVFFQSFDVLGSFPRKVRFFIGRRDYQSGRSSRERRALFDEGVRLFAVVVCGRYRERILGSVGQSGRRIGGRAGRYGSASVSGRPAYGVFFQSLAVFGSLPRKGDFFIPRGYDQVGRFRFDRCGRSALLGHHFRFLPVVVHGGDGEGIGGSVGQSGGGVQRRSRLDGRLPVPRCPGNGVLLEILAFRRGPAQRDATVARLYSRIGRRRRRIRRVGIVFLARHKHQRRQ